MNRLFHLARNVINSNFKELKFPYRFTYILTYKCQFKCKMCNIWQKSGQKELSFEQIERFFQKSNRFSWINLSGGEIFLRKDFMDIIRVIFENCRHLYLLDFPTNGFQTQLIVDNVKKILTAYKPKKLLITVSLDGPPKLHDSIRNVSGSWKKAVQTFNQLRPLRSRRFNVFFGLTLQPANIGKFEQTFKLIQEKIGKLSYNDFHVNLIQYSPHYYANIDNGKVEDSKKLGEQMESIIKLRKTPLFNPISFLERRYQRLAKIYLDKNKTPISCQALSASFFMAPEGTIYPCSIYDKTIGNIVDFDYDIYKLWNSSFRQSLRQEICQGNCPHCWTPCEAYQSILANLFKTKLKKYDQKSIFSFY